MKLLIHAIKVCTIMLAIVLACGCCKKSKSGKCGSCFIYEIYQQGVKIAEICDCGHVERSFADAGVFYKFTNKPCNEQE